MGGAPRRRPGLIGTADRAPSAGEAEPRLGRGPICASKLKLRRADRGMPGNVCRGSCEDCGRQCKQHCKADVAKQMAVDHQSKLHSRPRGTMPRAPAVPTLISSKKFLLLRRRNELALAGFTLGR